MGTPDVTYTVQVTRHAGPDEDYEDVTLEEARELWRAEKANPDCRMLVAYRSDRDHPCDEWVR